MHLHQVLEIQPILNYKIAIHNGTWTKTELTKTSYAAIYEYAYLISVGLFGWLFWGVVPGIISVLGTALITLAGVVIVLAQQQNSEE